jgi:hypothetical protein
VVEVKRDASTVLAMRAAFVDSDAGNLYLRLTDWLKIDKKSETQCLLCADATSVIEEEYIDPHQPTAHCPD